MIAPVASALLVLGAAAPQIVAPAARAQTTQPWFRFYAVLDGAGAVPKVQVNGADEGSCELGGPRRATAHCSVRLEPGENTITITDPNGSAELKVLRYVTTGEQIPGVQLNGWGEGTVHRPEIEAQCATCHAMNEAEGKGPADMFAGTECVSCHRTIAGRPKVHAPVAKTACAACHDPASRPQRYAVQWPIQDTCLRCHEDIRGQMERKLFRHGPTAAGRCTTCHDPHGSANPFWLKKPIFDLCTNCHPEKATERHVVVGFVYGNAHPMRDRPHPVKPGQEFACSGCHNPHAAQSRFLWQYDATVRDDLCRTCHQK